MTDQTTKPFQWGILGPGKIAGAFAHGLNEAKGAGIAAVGSRDAGRAEAFAAEYGVTRAYGSYEELVADPDVEAVYVASPHSEHEAHTLLCLEAGKHVLCEKAFALNAVQSERMIACAADRGLVLREALWTRFLPAVVRARELVEAGTIGEVRLSQADFGFRAEFDPASRLFAPELAGGTLLDLGIYPLQLAFLICGEPVEILTAANLGRTGVDEETAIILRHAGGALSVMACSFTVNTPREATIIGTKGRITLRHPWWGATRFSLLVGDGPEEDFEYPNRGGGYTYEAEAFMDLIRTGNPAADLMPLDETLALMQTMDAIRARWGLRYPGE
jgi:predicted dehydrogenase